MACRCQMCGKPLPCDDEHEIIIMGGAEIEVCPECAEKKNELDYDQRYDQGDM